jgi:hypothetical protein
LPQLLESVDPFPQVDRPLLSVVVVTKLKSGANESLNACLACESTEEHDPIPHEGYPEAVVAMTYGTSHHLALTDAQGEAQYLDHKES